ncbi:MAG TPA: 5-oxopent-3-ene-1,2,5-tricarboxylate decarboxylase [Rhodospirillaceae bacterium]|nr:5-oxopent-3-ene-1,2,5-tricarboxylate decarboxylase [Rhodospirillaceae bacterium]HAA90980.1 5-oxopent-3-ene-1,2,5-tricarboxylate decarboxylase [Rhodospirillaceae bacterium]HAT36399.1 5-oxopent-3-ene-1,2,5-tricarboxylate decarboxylase [Rhodospirillaceae bacterium]
MRFVTFESDGLPTLGVRLGDEVVDLSKADPSLPGTLAGILEAGDGAFEEAQKAAEASDERIPYEGLSFCPVIPRPSKIICIGLNYAAHAAEGGHDRPTFPSFFMRGATSLTGHLKPIVRPKVSETLDYEAELVAVIGKRSERHTPQDKTLDLVAGYSMFNEASVREWQRKTQQYCIGKNFDDTGAFGPDFITANELPAGGAGLSIQSRLNGEVMQDDNTSNMMFDVSEALMLLTQCMTLEPGDILVTGTPSGVGHARKPPVWMKGGDTVEVEIEGIGILQNPIVDEE